MAPRKMGRLLVPQVAILDRTAAGSQDLWEAEADANLQSEQSEVTAAERAGRFGQQPATILLTGYMTLRRYGVFDAQAPFWTGYLMLTLASVTLAAGLCWAHFKRRVIGTSQVIYPPP